MIFFGDFHHLFYGHDAVNYIKGIERFSGASDPVGLFAGARRTDLGIGVAHVSVLQLLGVGSFIDVLDKISV